MDITPFMVGDCGLPVAEAAKQLERPVVPDRPMHPLWLKYPKRNVQFSATVITINDDPFLISKDGGPFVPLTLEVTRGNGWTGITVTAAEMDCDSFVVTGGGYSFAIFPKALP